MGFYSSNRTQLGMYSSEEIIANENYNGIEGAMEIVFENHLNDQRLFECLIKEDFKEAYMIREGYEIQPLNEASKHDFIDKIKEFVKNVWAKIKGLFDVAIAKIASIIKRDNKEYVSKYKSKAIKNTHLDTMKYKWSEPTNKPPIANDTSLIIKSIIDDIMTSKELQLDELKTKLDDGTFVDSILSKITGLNTNYKDLKSDMQNNYFEVELEVEGLSAKRLGDIINILETGSKQIDILKKGKKNADAVFSKLLSKLDSIKSKLNKENSESGNHSISLNSKTDEELNLSYKTEKEKDLVMKQVNLMYNAISKASSAYARATGIFIDLCKFEIKQARRVFAKAVTYKALKEEALLVEAVADASDYEIDSAFESYEV